MGFALSQSLSVIWYSREWKWGVIVHPHLIQKRQRPPQHKLTLHQHLIHDFTRCQLLLFESVIVSWISRDTWVKGNLFFLCSALNVQLCVCCSAKSSFPLLTERASGRRSRHETCYQSGPVSHSSDTQDHAHFQLVSNRCFLLLSGSGSRKLMGFYITLSPLPPCGSKIF